MIKKGIFMPYESAGLIPNYTEINYKKLRKMGKIGTRVSKLIQNKKNIVLDSPGILVTDDFFILNGKHRALKSYICNIPTEYYMVEKETDLLNHTPKKAFGSSYLEILLHAFNKRKGTYIPSVEYAGRARIKNIADFLSQEELRIIDPIGRFKNARP